MHFMQIYVFGFKCKNNTELNIFKKKRNKPKLIPPVQPDMFIQSTKTPTCQWDLQSQFLYSLAF